MARLQSRLQRLNCLTQVFILAVNSIFILSNCAPTSTNDAFDRSWMMLGAFIQSKSPDNFSGLSLWYKADALSASNDDPIGTWSDSSGNLNDALQGTMANQPLYKSAVLNGQPVLEFDGSNDSLQSVDIAFSQITILTVARFTKDYLGTGWRGAILSKRMVNPNNNVELYFQWGSATAASAAVLRSSTTGTNQFFSGTSTDQNSWYIISAGYDGERNRIYSAGTQRGQSGINAGSIYDNASSFFLGRDNSGGADRFQGQMAEVIMYDRFISDDERAQVECFLSKKYALYVTHFCY